MKKLKFVCWNIGGKNPERRKNSSKILEHIKRLVFHYQVDVLVLIENLLPKEELLEVLNEDDSLFYCSINGSSVDNNILILTKFDDSYIQHWDISEEDVGERLVATTITIPTCLSINFFAVHLPSKLHEVEDRSDEKVIHCVKEINTRETQTGHKRSIVAGDFNANPFEPRMTKMTAFNAVMDRNSLKGNSYRKSGSRHYEYFYNPMWSLMGDLSKGNPGTYYNSSSNTGTNWNMFDQVLFRKDTLKMLEMESVLILDSDGTDSLLTKNKKIDGKISDHLPITFTLTLIKEKN